MSMMRVTAVAAATLAMSACGATRAPVYSADAVGQPAELVGCAREEVPAGERVEVLLSMVVSEEGRVVSARRAQRGGRGIRPDRAMGGPTPRVTSGLVQRAREVAMTCVYNPAMLNGMPVRSRVTRMFLFPFTPDYDIPPVGGERPETSRGGPSLDGPA